eukprot:8585445-Pyramimonas_sp.AAC.1
MGIFSLPFCDWSGRGIFFPCTVGFALASLGATRLKRRLARVVPAEPQRARERAHGGVRVGHQLLVHHRVHAACSYESRRCSPFSPCKTTRLPSLLRWVPAPGISSFSCSDGFPSRLYPPVPALMGSRPGYILLSLLRWVPVP